MLKRWRWALIGVLAAVAACTPSPSATPPPSPNDEVVVALFVGDSYTEGVGLRDPLTERWSALVVAHFGWREVNAGCSGSGYVRVGLLCGNTFAGRIPSLADTAPDVVVLWGGVNDVGSRPDGAATAAVATVAAWSEAFPDAQLIVVSAMYFSLPEPDAIGSINRALQADAAGGGYRFLDIGPILADDPSLLGPDRLHPNARGHEAIAHAVIDALGAS